MPSFIYRMFSVTCQVGVIGGLAAAAKYRYDYSNMPTDPHSTYSAFTDYSLHGHQDVYDVAIVGGGIIGVATARELLKKYPRMKVALLEKEADVAQHQSGHNSGCIHAGMFYTPGSVMSRLCPRGASLIIEYCKKNKLPYELCGKLLVATEESQIASLHDMYEWGTANGVKGLEILNGREAIQRKEPYVEGIAALWSPNTGIVDFAEVTRHMHKELCANPKHFSSQFQFEALDFVGVRDDVPAQSTAKEMVLIRGCEKGQLGPEKTILAHRVITCCGLGNDVVAKHCGPVLERVGTHIAQTYSFRGRYYQLRSEKRNLVRSHVYPCPDYRKGMSVGVHFTPTVDVRRQRQVIIGPGSALALDRYGYNPYAIDLEYCFHSAFSKGGWSSLLSNFTTLLETYYLDLSKKAFLAEAQKLIPSVGYNDIEESFCGVMGLGVGKDGSLCSDLAMEFARPRVTVRAIVDKKNPTQIDTGASGYVASADCVSPLVLNVRNAPSPAATSCMSIAEEIVSEAGSRFKW